MTNDEFCELADALYAALRRYQADMLAAAPAAPPAEPADRCRSSETPDPKATGRSSPERPASNREDAAAMVAAGSGEQAEPKREPTCLWSHADDDTDVWETSCGHAFTIIEGTPTDNHMEFCCYCGRPLEQEIGGRNEHQ